MVAVRPQPVKNTSLIEDGEALPVVVSNPMSTVLPVAADAKPRTSTQKSNWFAAYTTPRHEKTVARQFETRHIESFLPLYKTVRRWKNGCRMTIELPLFPSYVFVCIERRDTVKVLQVPGVLSIVSAGRQPAALPASEIESLRSGLPQRHFEPHPYLVLGQKVRIISGSLAGMVGVLVRKKNNLRVVLTLDQIRQSVAVEVGVDEIEPIRQ